MRPYLKAWPSVSTDNSIWGIVHSLSGMLKNSHSPTFPVQELQAVNKAVINLHSALPNPYTLLGLILLEAEWFTCLNLKDAFFCLLLAPSSQALFAFEWENPTTGAKEQFTWTTLPQGFKHSPTLFSGALARDLSKFPGQDMGCILLQYVDDLLLASSMQTQFWEGTQALLRLLTETGYWVFKRKAQICQREIKYLGFSDLAKPLYEALKGEENAPISWGPEQEKTFTTIKTKITEVPALGLPDNNRVALGVLTQGLGPWQRPVATSPNRLTQLPLDGPHDSEGTHEHDSLEALEEVYSSWPDLTDRPLQNLDLVLFTDGSSFLDEGKRRAGYAVISNFEIIDAQALPEGWSSQRAELWALVRALNLSKDKSANIYIDSRYAFATLHIHGAIYKERGLLMARGKGIKNQNEILKLLEAVWDPKEVVVTKKEKTQCQKGTITQTLAAKEWAVPSRIMLATELPEPLKYTPQEVL
ncbi:hypothetical protein QTO34_014337, partial [Cnephaeus nilssonii]